MITTFKKISAIILAITIVITFTTTQVYATETSVKTKTDSSTSNALTNQLQVLYNEHNGMSTSEANTVIQTQDGYIWIGSYGGLIRYDGSKFRNFSQEKNNMKSSSIRALFEDDENRLLIGTNDFGVYIYENNQKPALMP